MNSEPVSTDRLTGFFLVHIWDSRTAAQGVSLAGME